MSDNESEMSQTDPTKWDASTAFSSNGSDASDTGQSDGMDLDDRTKFLTDLTAVMQTTAASEKARNAEITEARRKTHIDSIRAREAMEAEELRELAKEDVKGIDAWSEGEIKRIKLERERRIASRREQLQIRLEEHRSVISREVEGVESAVAAYRVEMDDFFTRLGNQTDPVEFARQAGSQPAFPDLAKAATPEPAPASEYGFAASPAVAEPVVEAPYQAPEPEPVVQAQYEAPAAEADQESAEPVAEYVAVTETEAAPLEQAYEAPAEQAYEPQQEQTHEAPAEQAYEAPAEQSYEAPAEQSYETPVQEGEVAQVAEAVQEAPAEPSIPVAAQDDQELIGVMDPGAGGRPVETPWDSGIAVEQQQEAEAAVAEAPEGGEAAEPEPEPVAAGEQVVMPRSSGAGSWLRWPSSSVDRSDPNH
jgi:hypothetical protein